MILYWLLVLAYVCVGDEVEEGRVLAGEVDEELLRTLEADPIRGLGADVEYEELRAELSAAHAALRGLVQRQETKPSRKSMKTTPCWQLGGICVHKRLCTGEPFLTEVHGCMSHHEVCCFSWNKFKLRDLSEYGIMNHQYPWSSNQQKFGGKGIVVHGYGKINKEPKAWTDDLVSYNEKNIESEENFKPKPINLSLEVSKEAVSNAKNISLHDALERILNDKKLREYIMKDNK